MKTMIPHARRICLVALLAIFLPPIPPAGAVSFTEPSTIFYGKILGLGESQNYLITEGALAWTMLREDGTEVTLNSSLFSFNQGEFSYRLQVPHSALALGLATESNGIPLPPTPANYVHLQVTVDGEVAQLLGPSSVAFTLDQLQRASTYRLDLGLFRGAVDTDGDGLPDWWEDLFGLDKQDSNDAGVDTNDDGITALQAYRLSLDPNRDARTPSILTDSLVVYPSGTTAILLDTADIDSTPAQLVYTLTGLPPAGTLTLRQAYANPAQPDAALVIGSQFTQADLLSGRLVYDHSGSDADPGTFTVTVSDEDAGHPADQAEIRLLAYRPAPVMPATLPDLEQYHYEQYGYAAAGYVAFNGSPIAPNQNLSAPSAGLNGSTLASYISSYGDDRPYVMTPAPGDLSTLTGGHRDDVLLASTQGFLFGGLGADEFQFLQLASGQVTVGDYAPAEGDVLDLSSLSTSTTASAHQFLQFVETNGVVVLRTDLDGNGVGFTNLSISLPGLTLAEADLYDLVAAGALRIGSLQLEPMIDVVATQPQASENGPTAGQFTLHRRGSLVGALTVQVSVSGSAQNGLDFQQVPTAIVMPAGVASVPVDILPYADGLTEPIESVQFNLLAGSGYRLSDADQAVVTIEDLLMLVSIEAVEALAVKDTATPGQFMITRSDLLNRDVVIRLIIGGTAANGSDYNTLSTLVYMAPNQSVAFLQVVPKAGAQLSGGMETVVVSIKPDAAYRVNNPASAQVALVERIDSFGDWLAREFPEATNDPVTLAQADAGQTGMSNFERYAFGLDSLHPDPSDMPRVFLHEGTVMVSFKKPLGLSDVHYRVSGSSDLMNWSGAPVTLSAKAAPAGMDDTTHVYYEVTEEAPVFIVIDAEWAP